MTDFEIMVSKLRSEDSSYREHAHFEIYEWEESKAIEMRPSSLYEEWIYFDYDKNGNLLSIY